MRFLTKLIRRRARAESRESGYALRKSFKRVWKNAVPGLPAAVTPAMLRASMLSAERRTFARRPTMKRRGRRGGRSK